MADDRLTIHRCRHGGYSLIEVAMVLATITLMAAIAAPRYGVVAGRYSAEAAARRLAEDLAMAQSHARATSKSQTVLFAASTSSYRVSNLTSLQGAGTYTVDLRTSPYNAKIISVSFAGGSSVTFDRYGQPSNSGTVAIRAGNTTKSVVLSATTGRATIQ